MIKLGQIAVIVAMLISPVIAEAGHSFRFPLKASAHAVTPALTLPAGTLEISADGSSWVPGTEGAGVLPGQHLRNQGVSRTVLTFTDGATVSLEPGASIKIDRYAYAGTPAQDEFAVTLIKGAARFVTGLIGHNNKARHTVTTSVATIGVRGTDFLLAWCPDGCPRENGEVEPGLHGKLWEGAISVQTYDGEEHIIGDLGGAHIFYVPVRQGDYPAGGSQGNSGFQWVSYSQIKWLFRY